MTVEKQGDSTEVEQIGSVTSDLTEENVQKLIELFPDVATEVMDPQTGETKRSVNFDALRESLGDVAEGPRERYQFTWPGKRAAKAEAHTPIAKTMRPVKQRSKNWDETKNLYIEGDNLDALKILRETYAGKVKLIYIDPPYNTGSDFIYADHFSRSAEEERAESGDFDIDGNRMIKSLDSRGRFHSDWCSMMLPRLLLARNLLTSDGAIFISIDDNEIRNLRNICDEVFGATNFIDTIIWQKRYSPQNAVQWFSESHDFILVYTKNKNNWHPNLLERSDEMNARYVNKDNDSRGPWKAADSTAQGGHGTAAQFYTLTAPNGKQHVPPSGRCWLYTQVVMNRMIEDNRIWFGEDGNNVPAIKRFLSEVKQGVVCQTIWPYQEVGHNQEAKKELKTLFPEGVPFDTPKPVRLMRRILEVASCPDSVVFDFFSGSASMAEAVIRQNSEDGGNRKFVLVQVPDGIELDNNIRASEYSNLCDVGEERIRRAGETILNNVEKSNQQPDLEGQQLTVPDIGFRVLRIESSNYKDMRLQPELISQEEVDGFVMNEKPERTPLDLLFEALPSFQLEYSSSIATLKGEPFDGYTVFSVNEGQLIACFDANIPESLVRAMANRDPRPSYVVVAEKSLPDSAARTNFEEIFKQVASSIDGSTKIRII